MVMSHAIPVVGSGKLQSVVGSVTTRLSSRRLASPVPSCSPQAGAGLPIGPASSEEVCFVSDVFQLDDETAPASSPTGVCSVVAFESDGSELILDEVVGAAVDLPNRPNDTSASHAHRVTLAARRPTDHRGCANKLTAFSYLFLRALSTPGSFAPPRSDTIRRE